MCRIVYSVLYLCRNLESEGGQLTRETPPDPSSHMVLTLTSATSNPDPTCSVPQHSLVMSQPKQRSVSQEFLKN